VGVVIVPEVMVKKGEVTVPSTPGIGFEVNERYVKEISSRIQVFQA
jgi:O-succinylbenzoate synthase